MNPCVCIQSVIETSIYLHCLVYIPLVILSFTIFSHFFFKIHYRTKAAMCWNILKVTVQCTVVKPVQYIVSVVKLSQAKAIALHRAIGVYFLRTDTKLSIYD